jgi:hypothetical protein
MQTLTIRRDQAVPGIVFQSSHGYKLLVSKVIDNAPNRTDDRHVQIEGHLHANPERETAIERYAASSTIEVELFDPSLLPPAADTKEPKEVKAKHLRVGYGVWAEGAPEPSRILKVNPEHPEHPGQIAVSVDWGRIVYDRDDLVQVDADVLHPLILDGKGNELGRYSMVEDGSGDPSGEIVAIVEPDESHWKVAVQWPEFDEPETYSAIPARGSDEPLTVSDVDAVR